MLNSAPEEFIKEHPKIVEISTRIFNNLTENQLNLYMSPEWVENMKMFNKELELGIYTQKTCNFLYNFTRKEMNHKIRYALNLVNAIKKQKDFQKQIKNFLMKQQTQILKKGIKLNNLSNIKQNQTKQLIKDLLKKNTNQNISPNAFKHKKKSVILPLIPRY